ncbi:adhesin-like protein [Planoprotostelium fungivorum]|uniref:Adhesin-like protein n=1 Tax=Planoprotostelium fungivorum TaxID=1890364 RepID=A0A2P6NGL9_9EUKA|nr:adhesin-like protein [Planoprotostelium fungivorum]
MEGHQEDGPTILVIQGGKHLLNKGNPHETTIKEAQSLERTIFPKSEAMDLSSELSKRNTIGIFAVDERAIILGYCIVSRTGSTSQIQKVAVHSDHRRKGIARRMLSRLIGDTTEGSTLNLWVDVNRSAAVALYNSLGFEVIRRRQDYYGKGRDDSNIKRLFSPWFSRPYLADLLEDIYPGLHKGCGFLRDTELVEEMGKARILLLFLSLTIAQSCDFYISQRGRDDAQCGSISQPCLTLFHTIASTRNRTSAILCIEPGPASYECPTSELIITNSITLRSEGGRAVLNCSLTQQILVVDGDPDQTNLTIIGFQIIDYSPPMLIATNLSSLTIRDCHFESIIASNVNATIVILETPITDSRFDFGSTIRVRYNGWNDTYAIAFCFAQNTITSSMLQTLSIDIRDSSITYSNFTVADNSWYGLERSAWHFTLKNSYAYNLIYAVEGNLVQSGGSSGSQDSIPFHITYEDMLECLYPGILLMSYRNNQIIDGNFGGNQGPFLIEFYSSSISESNVDISNNVINNCSSRQVVGHTFSPLHFYGSGVFATKSNLTHFTFLMSDNTVTNNKRYGSMGALINAHLEEEMNEEENSDFIAMTVTGNTFSNNNLEELPYLVGCKSKQIISNLFSSNNFTSNTGSGYKMASLALFDAFLKNNFFFVGNNTFSRNHMDNFHLVTQGDISQSLMSFYNNEFSSNIPHSAPLHIKIEQKCVSSPILFSFDENKFIGNQAGAVQIDLYCDQFNSGKINITGDSYINNTGGIAGAFYVRTRHESVTTSNGFFIDRAEFRGNKAVYSEWPWGGAVSIDVLMGLLWVNTTVFEENSAIMGGAIGTNTHVLSLHQSTFIRNHASTSGNDLASKEPMDVVTSDNSFYAAPGVFVDVQVIHDLVLDGAMCPAGYVLINNKDPGKPTQYSCQRCPPGTYRIHNMSTPMGSLECHSCPDHADCSAGGNIVTAYPNQWCYENIDQISCTPCPVGYCVNVRQVWNDTCIDSRQGQLCTDCKEGHSVSFWGVDCVPDSHCSPWTISLLILGGFLLVSLFVYTALGESAIWRILLNFINILSVLLISQTGSSMEMLTLLSFNMNASSGGSFCMFRGVSQLEKMLIQLGNFFALIAVLAIVYILQKIYDACKRQDYYRFIESINTGATTMRFIKVAGVARFTRALVSIGLFVYWGTTWISFRLVDCTKIGGEQFLVSAANVQCYNAWQILIFFFIVLILIPFPFFLVLLRRGVSRVIPVNAHYHAILRVLERPYKTEKRYWESVITSRGLLVNAIFFFVTNDTWRSLLLCFVCMLSLLAHLSMAPFKRPEAHILETICLFCLTFVALLELPKGLFISQGVAFSSQAIPWLEWAFTLVPLSFGSALLIFRGYRWLRRKLRR